MIDFSARAFYRLQARDAFDCREKDPNCFYEVLPTVVQWVTRYNDEDSED